MSEANHFHKREAAKILVELQNKTEDERLMDYRRLLLTKDNNVDGNQNSRNFQERLGQACWPWPYTNMALPYNATPIGYPTWSHSPQPQYWFPNCFPEMSTNPYIQAQFPAMGLTEYSQANFTWPMAIVPQRQAYVGPGQSNRRKRTQFTEEQLAIFEKTFTHGSKFPSPGEKKRLESETGISEGKISVWFSNRRAKEKREKGQDGGSKESTTTDSELETEDERQFSIYDETPEEDSEIEDTQNHQSTTSTGVKPTHPTDILINMLGDIKQPYPEGQSTSGFYYSEIQGRQEQQNNTTGHINLSHLINSRTNEPTNVSLLRPERKAVSDIRQSYLTNIHTITPKNMLSYPHPVGKINKPNDIKQPRSKETTAIGSSGLYHGEIQDTRNHVNNTTNVSNANISNQVGDSSTPPDIKIQPQLATSVGRVTRPEWTAESSKDTKEIGGTLKYPSTPSDNKVMKPPLLEGADARRSYHGETGDASNHQNAISDIKVLHQKAQSNIPSYRVLSLPGGKIAVEPAEQYHEEIEETRDDNSTSDGIELPYPLSISSNTAEIKVPDPGGTAAVDVSGLYHGEIKDAEHSKSAETRDVKLPQSANISTNAHADIKALHPRSVDLSGLYRNENENTSFVPPLLQTTTYCEKPGKFSLTNESTITDETVKRTKMKKDIDIAQDSESGEDGIEDFRFQNKKTKTDQDMLDTNEVTGLRNAGPECRMFGET